MVVDNAAKKLGRRALGDVPARSKPDMDFCAPYTNNAEICTLHEKAKYAKQCSPMSLRLLQAPGSIADATRTCDTVPTHTT